VVDLIFGLGLMPSLTFDRTLAVNAVVLTATLAVVSLFIFKFYKSTSKKNLIDLNLYKYNTSDHPIMGKVFAMFLYLIEYILFIPFLIMLWFAGLSIVLFLIAKGGQGAEYVLLIAAALIGAIRILAYIRTEIAADLAKLFPFVALSLIVLAPGEYTLDVFSSNLKTMPSLLNHIFSFVLVITFIEIVMRVFYTFYEFWKSEEGGVGKEENVLGILTGAKDGS